MGIEMRNRFLGSVFTTAAVLAIAGCAYNPPGLSERSLAEASDLATLLESQIQGLRIEEHGQWYGVRQSYDILFGFDDLKKPRTYGEQFCERQGGHFITLATLPAPVAPIETIEGKKLMEDHLGNMFGDFKCELDGHPLWHLEIRYTAPETAQGLKSVYGSLKMNSTDLYVRYTEQQAYAEIKQAEQLRRTKYQQAQRERQTGRRVAQQAELARTKQERLVNKKIGARVCQDRPNHRSMMGDLRLLGTVEQVQGDRIKVFVEAAHYTKATNMAPSNFSQQYTWVDYWEFFPCTFNSN